MKKLIVSIVLMVVATSLFADTGQRFDLKKNRIKILNEISNERVADTTLEASLAYNHRISLLQDSLLKLDNRIFESYEATIDRLTGNSILEQNTGRGLIILSLILSLFTIISLSFVYFANEQLNKVSGARRSFAEALKETGIALLVLFFPAEKAGNSFIGLHRILVFSILIMLVSFVGYLISVLGL